MSFLDADTERFACMRSEAEYCIVAIDHTLSDYSLSWSVNTLSACRTSQRHAYNNTSSSVLCAHEGGGREGSLAKANT